MITDTHLFWLAVGFFVGAIFSDAFLSLVALLVKRARKAHDKTVHVERNRNKITNKNYTIMKKVKIEFNYPEMGEHGTTFSLTVDNMDVTSAKALERLPEMIERQYKEYMLLVYGCPNPPKQNPSDTR